MGTTFDDADGTAVLSCPGVRSMIRRMSILPASASTEGLSSVASPSRRHNSSLTARHWSMLPAGQTHLPAGASVGRADDDVVVQMVPVQMRGDDVPVFTARDRLGQRDAHLVHPLRGHVLVRSERMLQMQRQHASLAHAVRA